MLKLKLAFVIFSIAAFAASVPTVAFYDGMNNNAPLHGYHLLVFGWIGLFGGGYAWLANPLLVVTLPLMFAAATRRLALLTGTFAFLLALSFIPYSQMVQPTRFVRFAASPLGPSYGLWLASTAFALAACLVPWSHSPTKKVPRGEP